MDSGLRLLNIPHAFVLSIVLIFAFIIRINLASFVYFAFSLIIPIVSFSSNSGHFRRTLICVAIWSIVCIGAQFIYNFVPRTWLFPIFKALFSLKVRRRDIGWDCDEVHNLLGQIGLHQLRGKASTIQWLNVLAPDVLVLLATIILLWRIRLSKSRALFFPKEYYAYDTKLRPDVVYSPLATNEYQQPSGYFQSSKFHNMILCVGFCLVGSSYPSLHTAPFFIAFVALATIWAFHRIEVQPAMWRVLRLCAQLLACVHLCFLYIYQLPSVHRRLTPQTLLARLFGFVPYINHQCFRRVSLPLAVETWIWPEILSPILIFCLHWMVSYQLSVNLVENMEDAELVNESQITNKTQTTMTASEMSAGGAAQEPAIPIIRIEGVRSRTGSLGSTVSTVKNIMAETIADGAKLLGLDANINQLKWESVEKFVQKNNYILCLLTMMAWSLLYHSWSTFVLLLTACLVWMHPRTELICRHIMPLVSIYAEVLLLLNLIYALPLTQFELPEYNYLRQLGVEKPHGHPPCMDLILKSIFNLVFWMTLNQNAEMAEARDDIQDESHRLESVVVVKPEKGAEQKATEQEESFIRSLSQLLHLVLSDFWILFVLAVLLYISVQQPVATYRIVYMAMFLGFVNLFQISFTKWRKMMYTFWMAMIGYCLFLLTLLYTYQFHGVPEFYTETLGLADDVTRSLGLERISSGELLFRLLTPISFLIFTLIQVNYCHERLLMITDHWEKEAYGLKLRFLMSKLKIFHKQMNYLEGPLGIAGAPTQKRPSTASYLRYYNRRSSASHPFYPHLHLPSKERLYLMLGRLEEKCKQLFEYRQSLWNIGWRIIEIHLHKLIAFYMVYVALNEVSILNFLLLIGAAALVCADSLSEDVANYSAILTTIIILLKMLYQLEFIRDDMITKACYESSPTSNVTAQFGDWFGLTKSDSVFDLTKMHLGLIFLLCCKTIVHIRQFMHRNSLRLDEPPKGILFPGINRSMADQDLFHCLLYMSNYFFYRFGVEVCMISTVVTIGYRSDFYSAIYALCLIALFLMSREEKRRYWPRYLIFLFALFVWQYFVCIGIPSYLCWGYPWDDSDRLLVEWLNLPSTKHPANSFKLMADFVQLTCVSCQLFAFKLEIKHGDNYEGGSNHDTTTTVWKGARTFLMTFNLKLFKVQGDQSVQKIGVPDFISESRTFLDRLKHVYFMYFYWITLAIIFIAGTTRVTLFSAGYILGCFFFLWMGNSLFFKPIAAVMRLWDLLMLYNVIAVFLKISLQAIGCVYMGSLYKNFCWMMQLFGIACFQSAIIMPDSDDGTSLGSVTMSGVDADILAQCEVPHQETGIFYDGLCFAFLLVQRRIFGSEYFKHVIAELNAQRFFASRGAELINMIKKEEILEAQEKEKAVLAKVKAKMERIKSKHSKEAVKVDQSKIQDEAKRAEPDDKAILDELKPKPVALSVIPPLSQPESSHMLRTDLSYLRLRRPSQTAPLKPKRSVVKAPNVPAIVLQEEGDNISDEDLWSVESPGDNLKKASINHVIAESGVKGLGPLQLLNFAFKKGALSDAMKESNEIEATHDRLERQMEQTYGVADYQSIRRAILKAMSRQKAKADYDEDTFDEDAASMAITGPESSVMLPQSAIRRLSMIGAAAVGFDYLSHGAQPSQVPFETRQLMAEVYEDESMIKTKKTPKQKKKTNKFCQKLRDAKTYVKEFAKNLGLFFFMFGQGVIESLISYMMRISRDYRYIAYILYEEKRIHKQMMYQSDTMDGDRRMSREDFEKHQAIVEEKVADEKPNRKRRVLREESLKKLHRCLTQRRKTIKKDDDEKSAEEDLGESKMGEKARSLGDLTTDKSTEATEPVEKPRLKPFKIKSEEELGRKEVVDKKPEEETTDAAQQLTVEFVLPEDKSEIKPKLSRTSDRGPLRKNTSSMSFREEDADESLLVRLVIAIYYAVMSRSEMICYLMIVLNHIHSASLISMPLPLMMLLWSTLTVPRPTKRFWVTVITYTEVIVVLKYIFQFGFFPWIHGAPSLDPFWAPRIIGIEKQAKYAAWDLALLMSLFFHRNLLMSIGLWKNEIEKKSEAVEDDMDEENSTSAQLKGGNRRRKSDMPQSTLLAVTKSTDDPIELKKQRSLTIHSIAEMVADLNRSQIKTRVTSRVRNFFHILLNPANRYPVDMYAPMFICDVACFLIVIFGYSSFATDQGSGSVTSYFQQNKVPGTLVAMLIFQFILMVVDRALFLRKFLVGKLVFQILLVLFVHVWMFLLLPAATGRLFTKNFFCQLWYFIKVIYFIISAKQIRSGYPKRQLGNVITNSYSAIYMVLYRSYMAIPFLFELSLLMDWMWIDTCLSLSNWIALHDIYSNICMIKCERSIEEDYPSPKGVKKRALIKYGWGGFLLFLIILIIWFPLVLFSMANTVGTRSIPVECTAKLTISGYQPLFESTARLEDIRPLTIEEYNDLYYTYRTSKTALSYIADYDNFDVVRARIDGNSSSRWLISPPARLALINSLNGTQVMNIQFDWQFKRAVDENLQYGVVEDFRVIDLEPGSPIRQQLVETIMGENNETQIHIPNLFPSMVEVPGEGKADHVNALLQEQLRGESKPIENAFTDVFLELEEASGVEWWKLRMVDTAFDPLRISEPITRDYIIIHGFVDKVFPKSFSFITGGGILGLYVSIVLVLGHYVRGMVTDSMKKMMFEELPNVDRLLQLCHDIFLVRDSGEFELEEDLFAKLVFLFRSPATLIKWTREKPA